MPEGDIIEINDKENYCLSNNVSYSLSNSISNMQKDEILELRPSFNGNLIKPRRSSLECNAEHSDVSLEDLENDPFGRSDAEDPSEILIDFEEASPYNKNGEKSPLRLKSGMKPFEELVLRSSGKIKILEEIEPNNDENVLWPLSPSKGKLFSADFQNFETPKKNGPRPIGILMERDDKWLRCSKFGCCDTVQNNCIIS